jgi:hypothetical protein
MVGCAFRRVMRISFHFVQPLKKIFFMLKQHVMLGMDIACARAINGDKSSAN